MRPEHESGQGSAVLELVNELQACADGHLGWALQIGRSMIVDGGTRQVPLVDDGMCEFSDGQRRVDELVPLRVRPWIDEARARHEALHRAAGLVVRAGHAPPPVLATAYDALVAEIQGFEQALRALEREWWQQASLTDFLTGFRNRHAMDVELEVARQRAAREGTRATLVIMDLDRFKGLNDQHGHSHGDEVLKRIAARVHERMRPYDSVYRLGGDEFLICLPDTGASQARGVVERLRRGIEVLDLGGEWSITASFGVAQLGPNDRVAGVIEQADVALYAAKRSGGNAVVVWNQSLGLARAAAGA